MSRVLLYTLWSKEIHVPVERSISTLKMLGLVASEVHFIDNIYLSNTGMYLPIYGYTEEYETCLTHLTW